MIKLSRFEKLQKERNALSFKPIIDDLVNSDLDNFLSKVEKIQEWDRPREDLFIWIPVLNKIDSILSEIVKKYDYSTSDPKMKAIKLVQMDSKDENTVEVLTEFTCRLLYHTENRYIYSSMDVMNDLLNCPNFKVKYGAIKVLAIIGERYIIARERLETLCKSTLPEMKKKALHLALALPSSVSNDDGEQFTLVDLFFNNKKYPTKWSRFKFTYYNNPRNKDNNFNNNKINSQTNGSSMRRISFNNDDLKKFSLKQLFEKGMEVLPYDTWYEYSLKITIAKAFSDDTPENIQLRNIIVQTKFLSVAFINTVFIPPHVSSKLFEVDPYTFNCLTDFISLAESRIPGKLRLDALFALECISLKHVWCSDIMRNLGGNLSHGILFQILRQIGKLIRNETNQNEDFSEEYNVRFFYLISNLAEVKTLHDSLLAAGLIPSLLEIVSAKDNLYRRTKASATHLLEAFINDVDSTAELINYNGFTLLIDCITEQVNAGLTDAKIENTLQLSTVDFLIPYRQQAFIKSLLKLVLKLLKIDSGDRIRNLIDSPILGSLLSILKNMEVFGSTLVSFTLDVIQRVINSEPTIYTVLVEAGLIPYIIENFSKFITPHSELLYLLPDVISALCLNSDGLKKVKERNLIDYLFKAILDPTYARELSWKEEATDLGTALDELARHYPDLKPGIIKSFCDTVKEIPSHLHFNVEFLHKPKTGGTCFYHSREEPIINNEENGHQLNFWDEQDSSVIIDCFSNLLYGMTLDNSTLDRLPEVLNIEDLYNVIVPMNAPFDYTSSQAMLNITDVLQILDGHHSGYNFQVFLEHLNARLCDIKEFLTSPNETSYFLGVENDDQKIRQASYIVDNLNGISSILHIITNVYVTLMTLSNSRVQEIIDFFQKESNFDLLTNLCLLFQKAGLEEMYIRSNLPDEVVAQTTPDVFSHMPPIHIHRTKPVKNELKDDFTSAKFKNTFQIRNILNRVQSCIAILLRCFLRLSHATSMDLISQDKVIELRIFDSIIQQLCSMVEVAANIEDTSYILVLLHFNTYIMSFPKTTIATTEMIQTIPAYLFYQKGGYQLYTNILLKLFDKLTDFVDIEMVEKIDYLEDREEVLILSAVTNILTFFNRSIQQENMESIRTISNYYVDIPDYNITKSLMKRLKMRTLNLLSKLGKTVNIFHSVKRTIPYGVFKQILTLWKNAYTMDHVTDSDKLYMIEWDLIIPSERKLSLLLKVGVDENVARNYLESHRNKLPSSDAELSMIAPEQREHFKSLLEMERTMCPKLLTDEGITGKDLEELRKEVYHENLESKIFDILPLYPKLVNAIAKTLIQIFTCLSLPIVDFITSMLKQIQAVNIEDEYKMSSFVHLFGIFLNEGFVYQQSINLMDDFVEQLEQLLKPNYVNKAWFSKFLYCYEIILSKSELPTYETPSDGISLRYKLVPMLPVYRIKENLKQTIFKSLIKVAEISNFYSALAISRIFLISARERSCAIDIINSGIISRLLKAIGIFQKYDRIKFLESSFLLLVRRCFESDEYVSNMIKSEIDKCFTSRTLGNQKEKERDLASLLEEKSHVVMRNPTLFTNILSETARFTDFGSDDVLLNFTMRRYQELKKNAIEENSENWQPSSPTGIIHLLLSQLMAVAKKDWISEPTTENGKARDVENDSRHNTSKNPAYSYMIFLLKMLAELVSSYKQCKFEFLTYSRRNIYTERPRQRSTALNFFLYQLLDKSSSQDQNKEESKKREVISMLAKSVLIGFLTSVNDASNAPLDPKKADCDLTFIRKFVIETLVKVLKSASSTSKLLEQNVDKLDSWFNIIGSMVYVQAPYLRVMVDSNKIEADRYQICRLMIDLNVPTAITDCMSKLDLNYPFCKKLFNDAVEALNAINSTRSDFVDYFKVETHEEDVDVEEESEKEEVPNMFRNSALGMYDVEDIEEDDPEDDEDDSLIGDDEGIAFVNDDEEGYEVVFSDDEGDENDEGTVDSLSDDSSIEEIVFEVGSDEISDEDMEDVESGDEFSGSEIEDGYSDSDNEQFNDEVHHYDSDLDIDISDYYEEESDWDSGLTDLTTSEEDSDTNDDNDDAISPVRLGNGRTIWSLGNGVELEEEISDDEEQGVFHGIQHVFNTDDQFLFRVHESSNRGNNHQRVFRRHPNSSMVPPSISLLNGNRRNQSNLINPLGPTGLEQVENDITAQLATVGTGVRPRTGRPHFADVLFSGEVLDERILDGIVMKSTLARWKDIFDMFYDSKSYANYLIPSILNRLFRPSLELYQSTQRKRQEKIEKLKEERNKRQKLCPEISGIGEHQILANNNYSPVNSIVGSTSTVQQNIPHSEEHEPVYVNIEGAEVNIAGTDIDPEFLNALPEDMRAEVLVQHIRERRADMVNGNASTREVDAEFLNSLPEDIRDEILEQEAAEERMSNVIRRVDESSIGENEDFDMLQDEDDVSDSHATSSIHDTMEVEEEQGTEEQKKKQERVYFEPLIDRQGTAALMKSVFIVQPYIQREIYHELFLKLCSSKQNRNDIVNILLMILQEGATDQNSLEKVYGMIVARSQSNTKISNLSIKQLPPDTTPLTVANQAIEILQYLIDSDSKIKFFFITEHENLLVSKNKRDDSKMKDKLPIKYLFSLFDRKLITDETILMDLLTNILQTCTKPFPAMLKNKNNNSLKKKFNIPSFDAEELRKIVSIIRFDSCSTKVFQQTLNILYHLCATEGTFDIFTEELSKIVKNTTVTLIDDIKELTKEVENANFGNELNVDLVQKLTLPSSEQAKLLKVLTAVDYLYTHKKEVEDYNAAELISLYNSMDLGKLWLSLSDCMSAFEKKKNLSASATLLLPVIESLMVISKHCRMNNSSNKLISYREGKLEDLENVDVENLFVPFTDQHKKLLNQMIRTNPKLMSGPFSLLIKNSKVLDFDNKRYYFIAKVRSDSPERPKLPITVRRDQVFLDSYRALFFKTNEEIKNSKLEITFKGESGVDAGGLTREWYQVLSRQMFNPDYALFLPVASDKTTFHPNRTSGINPEHLSFFKFSGMIIAKAIRDQCFLDCHFSREVYKNILGKPVSLKDMESLDPDYYKSLVWILENDITDIIEETFSVETDDYGEHKVVDLIENGRNIAVTESNKQEYVKKIVEYKLNTSVKEQMDNFLVGFYSLIPKDLISIFDEQEVELLISGLPDIDVDDWKNNTTYVNYTASCKQVNYFWRAVRSFDVEERAKLLQFVTGTSKVPLNGFKELSGANGTCKFSIHRDYGSVERLPSSHTCFNQLNLPAYNSYETLRSALLHAINEGSEGFGLA